MTIPLVVRDKGKREAPDNEAQVLDWLDRSAGRSDSGSVEVIEETRGDHRHLAVRREDPAENAQSLKKQMARRLEDFLLHSKLNEGCALDQETYESVSSAVRALTRKEARAPRARAKAPAGMTGLNSEMLQIGSWLRFSILRDCLLCLYAPSLKAFCWYLAHSGTCYKIQFTMDIVESITFVHTGQEDAAWVPEGHESSSLAGPDKAKVEIRLAAKPACYVEKSHGFPPSRHSWARCEDFTEGGQLGRVLTHTIHGDRRSLLQDLVYLGRSDPHLGRLLNFRTSTTTTGLDSLSSNDLGSDNDPDIQRL